MASCPNCGFDLNEEGKCTVCGYGTESQAGSHDAGSSGAGTTREPAKSGSNRMPIIIGAIVVVVLLAVGVFVLIGRGGGSSSQVASVTAPKPAGADSSQQPSSAPEPQAAAPAGAAQPETNGTAAAKAASDGSSTAGKAADPAPSSSSSSKISRVGFSAPVGASPESIRATHPVDLYNPSKQPVYDITKRTAFPPLTNESAYVDWMLAHTDQKAKYLRERWVRAQKTVQRHLVIHRSVLMGFLLTPREWFGRSYNLSKIYENTALPIGYGQTISGPDLVAHMTDALDPQPNQKILEIGTGSGFQSAFLSHLSNYVYTIEIVRPLAEETNQIYLEHTKAMPEFANIHRRLADGYYGWPEYAPFDRIIVTTGIDHIPPDLLKELKPGGIMVIPIGPPSGQTILKITKTVDKNGEVHLTREDIYHGIRDIFVPFTASGGGTHDIGSNSKTSN